MHPGSQHRAASVPRWLRAPGAIVLVVVSQLAVLAVGPGRADAPDSADPASPGLTIALVSLVTVAVQSSTEELFLRGYLVVCLLFAAVAGWRYRSRSRNATLRCG